MYPKILQPQLGPQRKAAKTLDEATWAAAPSPVQTGPKKTRAAAWGELGGVVVGEMGQTQKVRGYIAPLP